MATEVKLPEMGEGIEAGTVVRILVKPGDAITENQALMELETDKALVEVPSSADGTVEKIHVSEGEQVKVGATLVSLKGGGEPKAEAKAQPSQNGKPEADDTPKSAQDSPKADPESGRAAEPSRTENGERPAAQPQPQSKAADQPKAVSSDEIIPAGPATRRLARELGLELSRIPGSGQNGRITPEDVKAFAQRVITGAAGPVGAMELPDFAKWGPVRREAMSQVRRLTAEHMARSWNTVPHVTQFERADITELIELQKRYEGEIERAGGKLTPLVLIIRAVLGALKALPEFNASIDPSTGELVYKDYYNIGIAVDTDRGLLVPVLRDADRKDITQLSVELVELAERARSGRIDVEQLRGGTFSISNQGGIGGAEFTPIVNWPEAAILGVGRARKEPAVVGDVVKPRMMCPLALSYDHRVIDGAMAARFIRRLKDSLESPERLLMGL